MRILRNRVGLVWLTLIAFSVQLAVVVLHHHGNALDRGLSLKSYASAVLCSAGTPDTCAPASHDDRDHCILCWATTVAAVSLTFAVPELPQPQTADGIRLVTFQSILAPVIHRENFQARGPPNLIAA